MSIQVWERFNNFVIPEPNSGCQLWVGGVGSSGYGVFWNGEKTVSAHRFSYEFNCGVIPDNLVIDHICRNRLCVNPEHMRIVTTRTNVLENSEGRCAANLRKTHCKNGHEFTEKNTRRNGSGRKCIECDRKNALRYKARKRLAAQNDLSTS